MQPLTYEEYNEKMSKLKTLDDVNNFVKELVAPTVQKMLEAEISHELGYPKNHPSGNLSGNNRNGYSKKTIKGNFGAAEISIPRDRNGNFEPIAVKKYESCTSDIENKIVSMYAKGMSTRDINDHMRDIYGVNISSDMVSAITDKVIPMIQEWQVRPLDPIYPIVYLDGIHFKVRESGKITSKCAYIALGVKLNGYKEILGIWIGENEGSKFWMSVLNEMSNRGLKDICIACIDGLKGFSEAIKAVFPKTEIQKCIIHQIRNTTKYIPHKDKKKFCADLKVIYTSPTEESAKSALESMKEKWPHYAVYLESWNRNWSELSTFFVYPEEIRRIIYTTNTIESLNRQLRKTTKTTSIFPHNQSLKKLLWLTQRDITKKWKQPIQNWGKILPQFVLFFKDRINL